MHDHSRFQRDINDVTGVSLSLSLSLPLTKVTDAQYRKCFRASYNSENSHQVLARQPHRAFCPRALVCFFPVLSLSLYFSCTPFRVLRSIAMARRKACPSAVADGDADRSLHFSWDAEIEAKPVLLFLGESEQFLAPSSGETLHV